MRLEASGGVGLEEKDGERVGGSGQRIGGFKQKGEENKCEVREGETKRRERKDLRFEAESFRVISICSAVFFLPTTPTPQGLGFKPVKTLLERRMVRRRNFSNYHFSFAIFL